MDSYFDLSVFIKFNLCRNYNLFNSVNEKFVAMTLKTYFQVSNHSQLSGLLSMTLGPRLIEYMYSSHVTILIFFKSTKTYNNWNDIMIINVIINYYNHCCYIIYQCFKPHLTLYICNQIEVTSVKKNLRSIWNKKYIINETSVKS